MQNNVQNKLIQRATVSAVACSLVCGCVSATGSFRESLAMTPSVDFIATVDRDPHSPVESTSPNEVDVAKNPSRKKSRKNRDVTQNASADSERTRVSNTISTQIVARVRQLAWAKAGRTTDGNSFLLKRIRNGDNRTLIIGSLRGYDPPAIAIMDQLAEHLEYNASILGGVDFLLLRTANPDGLAHRAVTTSGGLELKNAFPTNRDFKLKGESSNTEVRFLVRLLKQFKPNRVILIGQSDRATGGVVYSSDAKRAARRFADAVELADYPLDAREQSGSFESFVVESGAEVISVQLPDATTVESGWPRFGVWLPALFTNRGQ